MKRLLLILLTSVVNIFSYDSVYLKVCTPNIIPGSTTFTRFKDTCKKINSGKLDANFWQNAQTQYQATLKQLEQPLDRALSKKGRDMVIEYIDGMNLVWNNTQDKYDEHVKYLLQSALGNEADTQGWTSNAIFKTIKGILRELRPLQADVKLGSKVNTLCAKESITENNVKVLCGITIENKGQEIYLD